MDMYMYMSSSAQKGQKRRCGKVRNQGQIALAALFQKGLLNVVVETPLEVD